MSARSYDVVISGGGMVGLLLACALGPSGMKVALVEARQPPRWSAAENDLRVSAVTVASRRIFENVGVWDRIEAARIGPFARIEAWDAAGRGRVSFDAAELGEPWLGYIVENGLIQSTLLDRLADYPNVDWLCPASVESIDFPDEGVELTLEDGRRLAAPLLVGADGARSSVREAAGIEVVTRDYGQLGIVANIRTEQPHGDTARQRFLDTGPLALLPLSGGGCSIVWSCREDEAQRLLELSDDAFAAELEAASEGVLGRVVEVSARASFPLRRLHAKRYVSPRVALVGDAAHVIHPLAGQGANLGFLDAAALAEVLTAARSRGRDPGSIATLRRYERWRTTDNHLMQRAMDGFHWLFANDRPTLAAVRNAGLMFTDRLPGVKRLFMDHAMGFGRDLPRLARPDRAA